VPTKNSIWHNSKLFSDAPDFVENTQPERFTDRIRKDVRPHVAS
jgi:hypothetical protein